MRERVAGGGGGGAGSEGGATATLFPTKHASVVAQPAAAATHHVPTCHAMSDELDVATRTEVARLRGPGDVFGLVEVRNRAISVVERSLNSSDAAVGTSRLEFPEQSPTRWCDAAPWELASGFFVE